MSVQEVYCSNCGWSESMHTDCKKDEFSEMDIRGEFEYSYNECPAFKAQERR